MYFSSSDFALESVAMFSGAPSTDANQQTGKVAFEISLIFSFLLPQRFSPTRARRAVNFCELLKQNARMIFAADTARVPTVRVLHIHSSHVYSRARSNFPPARGPGAESLLSFIR